MDVFPKSYWPGESVVGHLEFALKYDGVSLAVLFGVFSGFDEAQKAEFVDWILSKPTGKYARRAWFLFEFLMDEKLEAIGDLKKGSYVSLLDESMYVGLPDPPRVSRYRIFNNLLGGRDFCPVVRRTPAIAAFAGRDLKEEFDSVVSGFSRGLLERGIAYLYTAETKSSFQIEDEVPSRSKTHKFVGILERAQVEDYLDKERLVELQNTIVDERFCESDYRQVQNYVGQTIHFGRERIHYVCPHPDDVPGLMHGLGQVHQFMGSGDVLPLIHAAIVAYGFVFIHPFEDGNGRIHRFLIHNVLQLRGAVPQGMIFPVSATMLKYPKLYAESLESYSNPMLPLMDYELDEDGRMELRTPRTELFQFMDLTAQVEALAQFVDTTLKEQVAQELQYLESYDEAREEIEKIVQLPDRLLNLFIKNCTQNSGRLSTNKQKRYFSELTDDELDRMQAVIQRVYRNREA